MATFTSFNLIKYFVLIFLEKRTLNGFIDIGYFVTAGVFQLYVTYFLATRQDKISRTLTYWSEYDSKTSCDNTNEFNNKLKWIQLANGFATIVMSALKPVLLNDSFEELILEKSEETAEGLFLWTPEQKSNNTLIQAQYGTNINGTTYTLGIFGILSMFCWNLQVDCFKDFVIWIALVNKSHVLTFGNKIKDNLSVKLKRGENSKEIDDQCWATYRDVKEVISHTNSTYNMMLIISHVYSFLTFSYFLTFVLNEHASVIVVTIVGYNAVKGIVPYLFARTASQEVGIM